MLFEYRPVVSKDLGGVLLDACSEMLRTWAKKEHVVVDGEEAAGRGQSDAEVVDCSELLEISRRWDRDAVEGEPAIVMERYDEQITLEWRCVKRREIFGRSEVSLECGVSIVYPPDDAFVGEHVEPGAKGDEDAGLVGIVPKSAAHAADVTYGAIDMIVGAVDEVELAGVIGDVLDGEASEGAYSGDQCVGTGPGEGCAGDGDGVIAGLEVAGVVCFADEDVAAVAGVEENGLDVDEVGVPGEGGPIGGTFELALAVTGGEA